MESLNLIIKGCVNNDIKCQRIFYDKYYGYCLKVVFRYIYRYEKALDVCNDGFVKVFRYISRFKISIIDDEVEKTMMGWLKRIMVNTSIDELRKQQMMPEIGDMPEYAWEEIPNNSSADQLILYKELVMQAKKLPPSYRAVFNMFVIDGYSHQEIAIELGISEGTSKSALSKARAHLQKHITNKTAKQDYAATK